MQYLLTDAELHEARETLRAQLSDQTTLATAKAIALDALYEAIDQAVPDCKSGLLLIAAERAKRHWSKFPEGSPVRQYFEGCSKRLGIVDDDWKEKLEAPPQI